MNQIAELLQEAANASPVMIRERGPGLEPQFIDQPAAALRKLSLTSATLPVIGDRYTAPAGNMAGTEEKIDSAIIRASRVAAAGANVIIRKPPSNAYPTGLVGSVSTYEVDRHFVVVSPAAFANVADGESVAVTPVPALRATIKWDESVKKAVRFTVPRSVMRTYGQDHVAAEIMMSIQLGIGRACDELLLTAINAATPSAFSVAAAAAQGLKAGELRAIIGTRGDGAQFRDNGQLEAAGITAELTADMPGTLIGAWDRSAIAVHDEIRILAERLNGNGDLTVTCWLDLLALVPDPAKFWAVV